MARATAIDIARLFGTPKGQRLFPEQQQTPVVFSPAAATPSAANSVAAPTYNNTVARPTGASERGVDPRVNPSPAAPGTQAPPSTIGRGPEPGSVPSTPRDYSSYFNQNLNFQTPTFSSALDRMSSSVPSTFVPPPLVGGMPTADPNLKAILEERMLTGGLPPWEEMVLGQFNPASQLMDLQFQRAEEGLATNLARRGVLQSGEAERSFTDLSIELGLNKATLLADLTKEYEVIKQGNINTAIQSAVGLSLGELQARTAINTANIGAAAAVQSAAISATATVQSAEIHAQATLGAAQIAAQAALQKAGMDYSLAMREFDTDLILKGIDPVLFETDPEYRGDMIDYFGIVQQGKDLLIEAALWDALGIDLPDLPPFPGR